METEKFIFTYDKPNIYFEAKNASGEYEAAFYIFFNDKHIHTDWYSHKNGIVFDTKAEPGLYSVKWFVRAGGKLDINQTRYFLLNCRSADLDIADSRLDGFLPGVAGEYAMQAGDYKLPIFYAPPKTIAANVSLFVLFPGALRPMADKSIPLYHRIAWGLNGTFPGHVICVADPIAPMHEGMILSWLFGDAGFDLNSALARVARLFANKLHIDAANIVFYGSSQGGFVAISAAAEIEGSLAIAINPQTCILEYSREHVELFRKRLLDNLGVEQMRRDFGPRLDMRIKWRRNGHSRVFIYQNILDMHHYQKHFIPFWRSLGANEIVAPGKYVSGRHGAWLYSDPRGHFPETRDVCPYLLRQAGAVSL